MKDYETAMADVKKDIIHTFDSMLNLNSKEEEATLKELKGGNGIEIEFMNAISEDESIADVDKKSVDIVEDMIKKELNECNQKIMQAIRENSNRTNKVNDSKKDLKAITEKEASAPKQLNSNNEIEREKDKVKEKPKHVNQTFKPIKSKVQVIDELKKMYKPNERIGKKIKRKFD